MKSCSLWGELIEFTEDYLLWDRVWGALFLWKKEQQRQCGMNLLQLPLPISLRHWGEEGEEIGTEVESKKRELVEGIFFFSLFFLLSYFDLMINKLNKLLWVVFKFTCDGNWWIISLCPCLKPWAFIYISSPMSRWGGVC